MFDESQELFCILTIIVFWGLALVFSPLFAIFAVVVVLYVVLDNYRKNNDDDGDEDNS